MENKDRPFLRGWKLILFLYFLALGLSFLTRIVFQVDTVDSDKKYQIVSTAINDSTLNSTATIAFYDLGVQSNENSTIVALHGSPAGNSFYLELLYQLSKSHRVIAPDYLGYENSKKEVPDYSIKSQANYIIQLLDSVDIREAHFFAYSLGGGVALEIYESRPDLVSSISMTAAIGVQELELLGGYHLNHAIHGAQLGGLWLLHNAIPHFGLLDNSLLSVQYARSFYDTDQRPLRAIMEEFEAPMLIIHGEEDIQVPYSAALEHFRIVPQSELVTLDAAHNIVNNERERISETVLDFINRVNDDDIDLSKSSASPERLATSLEPYIPSEDVMLSGWALGLVMVLIILATLVSEDLTCIGAGLMVARGILGHFPAILACLLGIFIGDILIYFLGRWLGRSAIRRKPFSWFINEHDLDRSYQWFELKGPIIIIASRFVPGSRFPTYFTAGAIGASFFMFIIYFGIASLLWTPLLVEAAVLVGNEMITYFEVYQEYALWALLGILLAFMFVFKVIIPSFTFRGRRLLYSRYKRIINWEYWPISIIYLPVFFYSIYLAIKYKSITTFTAANPGIEDGGFKGESKSEILSRLKTEDIAAYDFIDGDKSLHEKMDEVHAFVDRISTSFPIVIKPDRGERGKGVRIVKDELLLEKALKYVNYDIIVQEFVPGKEFGVFYYRYPGQEKGQIFSITEKSMMELIGDGKHNLEHLILQDDRAVCLAEYHIDHHADHIFDKPADGEVIKLVELGTHARGAIFYDGMKYNTESLRNRVDQIAKEFDGFMFGRFDIRVPSIEHLSRGEDLTVIELNGVSSEATHIYNPGYTLVNAWKTLLKQWKIVYEIGYENTKNGHKASSLKKVLNSLVSN